MGAEKGAGSKTSGFFQLFDWNRKSRKKLFSISPEGTKQGKRTEETLPSTRLRMIDEEELVGSSIKDSSEYSCASSVTEEDFNGSKAPGVVARLMGLDSLPVSNSTEPYSTPFRDTRSFRDSYNTLKRSPEHYCKEQLVQTQHRTGGGHVRKPVLIESRAQKMPSSPIERFQMEALPPRSAKSLPLTYHKLLSPIKNPGFTSARNAAQIMEAAAKILEPRIQSSASTGTNNTNRANNFRVCNPKDCVLGSQRTSRLSQLGQTPVESNPTRFSQRQSEEDIVIFRPSPDSYGVNLCNSKCSNNNNSNNNNKGKSVSLAVQAKVNVQRREGLNSSVRHNTVANGDPEECSRQSQPFKIQSNSSNSSNQRSGIKQQKKVSSANTITSTTTSSTSSSTGVLRQNNQKQNCSLNRSKSGSVKSTSGQQGRKGITGDSSVKHKSVSKLGSNSKTSYRNKDLVENTTEKEGYFSNNKDFPQKKRLIERGHNVVIDEHTKWSNKKDNINNNSTTSSSSNNNNSCGISNNDCTDVVSFTFTSPLVKVKPSSGAHSLGLKGANGDALSLLLEQKLRELTARIEPSIDFSGFGPSVSLSDMAEIKVKSEDKSKGTFDFSLSENHKFQAREERECSKKRSEMNCSETELKQLSPLSVLDETFITESFTNTMTTSSSEGSTCSDGSKISPSSVQGQKITESLTKTESTQLSDSARSTLFTETSKKLFDTITTTITEMSNLRSSNPELDYVRDVLSGTDIEAKSLDGTGLDPTLFEKLERSGWNGLKRNSWRLLFDCVEECLGSTIDLYYRAGYQVWSKGSDLINNSNNNKLEKEVVREIEGWREMWDRNVDELVERDMGTKLGTWRDFRVEEFETGMDIEAEILDLLIEEVIGSI